MVAITVILAAVIAAFVFGMAGDMDSQKEVYATTKLVTEDAGTTSLVLTLQGGKDIKLIDTIECLVAGVEGEPEVFTGFDTPELGKSGGVNLDAFALPAGNYDLIIRATFKDKSQKVIVETPYTQG